MNTEIPPSNCPHDGLTTTRRSSQVCDQWRKLLLRSSSLWGRLIDIDLLDQPQDDWRSEVVSRTGRSCLWIRGKISSSNVDFFFALLKQNWTRVQRLDVTETSEILVEDSRKGWEVLCQPCPCLEKVRIGLTIGPQWEPTSSGSIPLFNDNAPLLREYAIPALIFNPRAAWLSNIHIMLISHLFTVPQALDALCMMPLLECLTIENYWPTPDGVLSPINLPQLKKLTLYASVGACLSILQCITPAPKYSLYAIIQEQGVIGTINPACQQLSDYLRTYIESMTTRFGCIGSSFVFCPGSGIYFDNEFFHIRIENVPQHSAPLLSEISIKKLILDFCNYDPGLTQDLILVFHSFHSVVELETGSDCLNFILKNFTDDSLPFPNLQTLSASSAEERPIFDLEFLHVVLSFLHKRKDSGLPISVLDLRGFNIQFYDLSDVLDMFAGLVVKWMDGSIVSEYICGGGRPEVLRFSQRWQIIKWNASVAVDHMLDESEE